MEQEPVVDIGAYRDAKDEKQEQLMFDILAYCVGEEITEKPDWTSGKLALWYGGEWEYFDEFSDDGDSRGRYPAGAYFETIALNSNVIQEPAFVADAALRINQAFDDNEFAEGFTEGLFAARRPDWADACVTLMLAADYGKAGHWPFDFNWETGEADWVMPPAELGSAVAVFMGPSAVFKISQRLSMLVQGK